MNTYMKLRMEFYSIDKPSAPLYAAPFDAARGFRRAVTSSYDSHAAVKTAKWSNLNPTSALRGQ
jgi:hypothetical protein